MDRQRIGSAAHRIPGYNGAMLFRELKRRAYSWASQPPTSRAHPDRNPAVRMSGGRRGQRRSKQKASLLSVGANLPSPHI